MIGSNRTWGEIVREKWISEGKSIAERKHKEDGKQHRVMLIESHWNGYNWPSLVVDDRREMGGKLGLGKQYHLADFMWPEVEK